VSVIIIVRYVLLISEKNCDAIIASIAIQLKKIDMQKTFRAIIGKLKTKIRQCMKTETVRNSTNMFYSSKIYLKFKNRNK